MSTCRLCAFIAVVSAVGCTGADNSASFDRSRAIKLALNWYPEAEHGGYYAADELAHFESHDRLVEIIPGSPGAVRVILQELAAGRVDFAVSSADQVVEQRARGLPIVALFAPLQQSPRCIMVHESSGFESLLDLSGVELSMSETRPFALWMRKKLPLTNVTIVPFNGLVGEFLAKKNFAQQAYVFSEPFIAQENGGDPKTLMLSEIGYNPYSSVLVTTESMIESQPDVVRDVVAACRAGWTDYLSAPEITNKRLHRENSEMSMAALEFGANVLQELCRPEDNQPIGSMTKERWETLIQQIDPDSVRAAECYRDELVD